MKRFIGAVMPLLLIAAVTACGRSPKAVQREGSISFVSGEVTLRNSGGATAAAKVGDVIQAGMSIMTGERAIAEVTIDESVIRIQKNTSIAFTELLREPDGSSKTALSLAGGATAIRVSKRLTGKDRYTVATPTIIAAVRGTEFTVAAPTDGDSVACFKGRVAVWRVGEDESTAVLVEAGQRVINEPGKPLTVRPLDGPAPRFEKNTVRDPASDDKPGYKPEGAGSPEREQAMTPRDVKKNEAEKPKKSAAVTPRVSAPTEKSKPEAELPR